MLEEEMYSIQKHAEVLQQQTENKATFLVQLLESHKLELPDTLANSTRLIEINNKLLTYL
jgi:hypothetical protein